MVLEHQKQHNKKIRRARIRKKAVQISKRVAMIILTICIASAAVTMSVEAYRVRFFNMIIETSRHFSSVTMEENFQVDYLSELPEEWSNYYYPTILPEGYKFICAVKINDSKYMTFSDEIGNEIRFFQGNISSYLQLDSENAKKIEVEINGKKGIVFDKDGVRIVSWHNNERIFYIQGNVDKSTLVEMAESVEKK
ncbi:DUF4367 domain-containing protein [bacterium AH-315-G05]|nr:DUF4367 domain-containing protein [bacterium AH-315-G05]